VNFLILPEGTLRLLDRAQAQFHAQACRQGKRTIEATATRPPEDHERLAGS
jgi:hypothetical protein